VRVYNANKGNTFLHQNRYGLKSKDQRKDAEKSQERRKGVMLSLFEVVFFAGFLSPFVPSPKAPTFGVLNPDNLGSGYKSEKICF
jgi:hypothetical protein